MLSTVAMDMAATPTMTLCKSAVDCAFCAKLITLATVFTRSQMNTAVEHISSTDVVTQQMSETVDETGVFNLGCSNATRTTISTIATIEPATVSRFSAILPKVAVWLLMK